MRGSSGRNRTRFGALSLAAALTAVGCGGLPDSGAPADRVAMTTEAPAADRAPSGSAFETTAEPATGMASAPGSELAAGPGRMQEAAGGANGAQTATPVQRRIIYRGDIELAIDSLETFEPQIQTLVKTANGYISDYSISGSPGRARSARWQVRIPADSFDTFVAEVVKLGELEANRRTSQEVTAEFVDLEARIKNKRVEEERIIKLLEERTGQLEDIIKIETELSRVRGEIEQMEGRLRLLTDQTTMSTVTIEVKERTKYEVAAPVAATFGERVDRTFRESMADLRRTGEWVALGLVALAPWLPFWLIGLIVVILVVRWFFRGLRRMAASAGATAGQVIGVLRQPVWYNPRSGAGPGTGPGASPGDVPPPPPSRDRPAT